MRFRDGARAGTESRVAKVMMVGSGRKAGVVACR